MNDLEAFVSGVLKVVRDERDHQQRGILSGKCSSMEQYRAALAVISAMGQVEDRIKELVRRFHAEEPTP